MRRLHLAWPCASSPENSLSDKSFLMLSHHLRFGLPFLLFPGTSITITLLATYSFSQYMPTPLQPTFLHFIGHKTISGSSYKLLNIYIVEIGVAEEMYTFPYWHAMNFIIVLAFVYMVAIK